MHSETRMHEAKIHVCKKKVHALTYAKCACLCMGLYVFCKFQHLCNYKALNDYKKFRKQDVKMYIFIEQKDTLNKFLAQAISK